MQGTALLCYLDAGMRQLIVKQAERDALSDSQERADFAQQLGNGVLWSEALVSVAESMSSGRRWLWDEAARKVATLLAAPAAFQGEHFLQVNPYL